MSPLPATFAGAVAPTAGGLGQRMIDRRSFLAVTAGGLLAAPLAAEARPGSGSTPRPGGRLPRVGYLGAGYPADRSSRLFSYLFEAFADGQPQSLCRLPLTPRAGSSSR